MALLRLILLGTALGLALLIAQNIILASSPQLAFGLDLKQPNRLKLGKAFNATCAISNFANQQAGFSVLFFVKGATEGVWSEYGIGTYEIDPKNADSKWTPLLFELGTVKASSRYRNYPNFDIQLRIDTRLDKYSFGCALLYYDDYPAAAYSNEAIVINQTN